MSLKVPCIYTAIPFIHYRRDTGWHWEWFGIAFIFQAKPNPFCNPILFLFYLIFRTPSINGQCRSIPIKIALFSDHNFDQYLRRNYEGHCRRTFGYFRHQANRMHAIYNTTSTNSVHEIIKSYVQVGGDFKEIAKIWLSGFNLTLVLQNLPSVP